MDSRTSYEMRAQCFWLLGMAPDPLALLLQLGNEIIKRVMVIRCLSLDFLHKTAPQITAGPFLMKRYLGSIPAENFPLVRLLEYASSLSGKGLGRHWLSLAVLWASTLSHCPVQEHCHGICELLVFALVFAEVHAHPVWCSSSCSPWLRAMRRIAELASQLHVTC